MWQGKVFLSHTHIPLSSFPEGIPSGCLLPGLCWATVCQMGSVQDGTQVKALSIRDEVDDLRAADQWGGGLQVPWFSFGPSAGSLWHKPNFSSHLLLGTEASHLPEPAGAGCLMFPLTSAQSESFSLFFLFSRLWISSLVFPSIHPIPKAVLQPQSWCVGFFILLFILLIFVCSENQMEQLQCLHLLGNVNWDSLGWLWSCQIMAGVSAQLQIIKTAESCHFWVARRRNENSCTWSWGEELWAAGRLQGFVPDAVGYSCT